MKLYILALVLLAACLTQAVKVNAPETQQTPQTTEKGQQATGERTHQKTQQTTVKGERAQQIQVTAEEEARQVRQERGQQPTKEEPQPTAEEKKQRTQKTTEQKEQGTEEENTQQSQQTTKKEQQTRQTQQTMEKIWQRQTHRILFMYPIAPRSHSSVFGGIINALAEGGHHVTVVSPHKPFEARDMMRLVLVEEGDASVLIGDTFQHHRLHGTFNVASKTPALCSDLLAKPQVQELLKEEFDVVVLSLAFSECFLSLVHQLKVPFIWVSPLGMVGMVADYAGTPYFPSYMGTLAGDVRHPLSFHQRAFATFVETVLAFLHRHFVVSSMERECRQRGLCPPDMPNLLDMSRNASLFFINSVRPLENPSRPAVPAEVHTGGIHCRPAKPLPQELDAWLEGAGEAGFIFFSMGSIIKPSNMPEKTLVALLEAFATLDQRVLWKWDQDTMKNLPPNVRLAKWLPQQDIIGHPRLRLFITHGGLMSTTEASYHGVPVLGVPVFGDQHNNMKRIQTEGWGSYLEWEELTADAVRDAIFGVMNDAEIQARAKHRAIMMRDQPMTPAEAVVFWVEYVIRHRGAPHLRCPAADLPWYKLYNVDVWVAAVAVVLAATYFTLRLMKALCSCLCRPRAVKNKKD